MDRGGESSGARKYSEKEVRDMCRAPEAMHKDGLAAGFAPAAKDISLRMPRAGHYAPEETAAMTGLNKEVSLWNG